MRNGILRLPNGSRKRSTAAKRWPQRSSHDDPESLERGRRSGIVIHKIDRSARNLRDWADLADLIDRGARDSFCA